MKLFNSRLTSNAILISSFSALTTLTLVLFTPHIDVIVIVFRIVKTKFLPVLATLFSSCQSVTHSSQVEAQSELGHSPLLTPHVCTIIRAGWCHQKAESPAALLSMCNWKMFTPGLSLILLNCMEGIIVILRLSGKAGTLIFLSYMAGELACHLWERLYSTDEFGLTFVAMLYD